MLKIIGLEGAWILPCRAIKNRVPALNASRGFFNQKILLKLFTA